MKYLFAIKYISNRMLKSIYCFNENRLITLGITNIVSDTSILKTNELTKF